MSPAIASFTASEALPEAAVHTFLLGGRVALAQSTEGHRAGTDAVLLARALGNVGKAHVLDIGASSGAVGLCMAKLSPSAKVTLVEIDPASTALARWNIIQNECEARVSTVQADLLGARADLKLCGLEDGRADIVVTNPPYLDMQRARISPDYDRARAHVMPDGGLSLWLKRSLSFLSAKGRLVLIHRADELATILRLLGPGIGAIQILPIHAYADQPAIRILLTCRKGSRAPMQLCPPLVLHGQDRAFTSHAADLHGKADLPPMFKT